MAHMNLQLKATRYTTREGDHHDDFEYIEQLKEQIELQLKELGFGKVEISLEFKS